MRRLAGMTGLIAAGFVAFTFVPASVEDRTDPWTLTYIATVYTLGIVVMLWYTRQWSTIGCALLATMLADALLYGSISDHIPMPEGAWALDLARSCFVIGGTYLLVGLVLWARSQRAGDAAMLTEDGT